MAFHIAQSGLKAGKAVTCPAQKQCTLKESDGSKSPHFDTEAEGDKWAVAKRETEAGGSHLRGTSRKKEAPKKVDLDAAGVAVANGKMTEAELVSSLRENDYSAEEIDAAVYRGHPRIALALLYSGNPNVTTDHKAFILNSEGSIHEDDIKAAGNGVELLPKLNARTIRQFAARTTDPKTLDHIVGAMAFQSEESKKSFESQDTALRAYLNPHASEAAKKAAAEISDEAAKIREVDLIEKEHGPVRDMLAEPKVIRKGKTQMYKFDPEKVRAAGLTKDNLRTFASYRLNNHLFGSTYNEETGVFRGYID